MNFAVLGAGIWGGAMWSKGATQWPLIIAAGGALVGALVLLVTYASDSSSKAS